MQGESTYSKLSTTQNKYFNWGFSFLTNLVNLLPCKIVGVDHPKSYSANVRAFGIQMITVSVFFLEIGVGEDLNQLLPVMENMMESLLSKVKGHS